MKRHFFQILWPLFVGALIVLIPVMNLCGAEEPTLPGLHCDIHQSPCSKPIGDCTVTLDIVPKPVKAMEDLTFTVTLEGSCSSVQPVIDLSMPGMIMGKNKVLLKKIKEGVFQGTGVIVRCPSGRKTWQATVSVPDEGSVGFIFDAVY